MRRETLNIAGYRFTTLVTGDPKKPLLLFLHGFPEYSGAFEDLLPHLAKDYFCVAPDQRGFGGSWKPADVADYAMPALLSDAVAVLRHYTPDRPAAAVIGHDWGAAVAYGLAFRHAALFDRLIIVNGVHPAPFQAALAAGGAQSAASQYIDFLRAPGSEHVLAANDHARMFDIFSAHMDMSWLSAARRQKYRAAWGDADGVRGMVNWYRASPLKLAKPGQPLPPEAPRQIDPKHLHVPMPHLLIWGMEDTALLPEARAGLDDFCNDLQIAEIAGADHWILHQKPGLVATHIKNFLALV